MYDASRVLRDFGEMLLTFAYPETPLFIANALLMLVIIYTVRKGIEVIARSGELLFMLMFLLSVVGFILIVVSGLIDLTNLQPVLEEGIEPRPESGFYANPVFPIYRSHCLYDDFAVFK